MALEERAMLQQQDAWQKEKEDLIKLLRKKDN
jgi:hypothetical protein